MLTCLDHYNVAFAAWTWAIFSVIVLMRSNVWAALGWAIKSNLALYVNSVTSVAGLAIARILVQKSGAEIVVLWDTS
jgi:hypothetical protein